MPDALPKPDGQMVIYLIAKKSEIIKYEGVFEEGKYLAYGSDRFLIGEELIEDPSKKLELVAIVNADVGISNGTSLCYEPHYLIRYMAGSELVQVELCYMCKLGIIQINGWEKGLKLVKGPSLIDAFFQEYGLKVYQ